MHSEPEHLNKKSGLKKMVKLDINNFTNSLKHYFPTEINGKTVKLIDFIKTVFFGQDYFKVSDLLWPGALRYPKKLRNCGHVLTKYLIFKSIFYVK